jgi:hypothetical protein
LETAQGIRDRLGGDVNVNATDEDLEKWIANAIALKKQIEEVGDVDEEEDANDGSLGESL